MTSAFKTHPTIDSVFLNAGTQSYVDFAKPDTVDLAAFQRECTVNFNAQVALVHAVLPHLLKCSSATSLIFTGTQVSLIPTFPMPAYSASKAALESFIICLREQLRETNVRVQHVSPGPVQTEIHANYGMLLEDFVNEAWVGLIKGSENIYPGCVGGTTKEQFLELVKIRDEATGRMSGLLREMMKKQWS
jgi:short-subunit dehydrogenase